MHVDISYKENVSYSAWEVDGLSQEEENAYTYMNMTLGTKLREDEAF